MSGIMALAAAASMAASVDPASVLASPSLLSALLLRGMQCLINLAAGKSLCCLCCALASENLCFHVGLLCHVLQSVHLFTPVEA